MVAEDGSSVIDSSIPTALFPNANPTILPSSDLRLNDERPNIIVIMTDDQSYNTVEYMPTVKVVLMKDGIYFKNAFATTPLCCPSRASILTGLYAHNHEVYNNHAPNGGATKFNDDSTFAVWLKNAGYSTAYFGKYMNEYEFVSPKGYVPPGWNQWGVFIEHAGAPFIFYYNFTMSENGRQVFYPKNKENFSADVITRKAVNFINDTRDQPFLLFLGYYNPHSAQIFAARHTETFKKTSGITVPRTPDFLEEDISDKPAYLGEVKPLTSDGYDQIYLKSLRSLLSVDDGVAEILNTLQQSGLSEKTIIVFLSDNGLAHGQHRWLGKNCVYEDCLRIPMIVYAPARFSARIETRMIANIDLAPTFAELAGVQVPENVNGISFAPLLIDPAAPWRDSLLFEHWPAEGGVEGSDNIPRYSAVRTDEWKYIEYDSGEFELYNLKNDPYELTNLANLDAFKEIQAFLKEELDKLK